MLEKIKAILVGHAIGDALGVPVEFQSREVLKVIPVTDMIGYGRHYVPAGTWSDDTSMTLCALDVLSKGKENYDKIIENFWSWCHEDNFTATGQTFDVGICCSTAIKNYFEKSKGPFKCGCRDKSQNDNGSLMRIIPFALYAFFKEKHIDEKIDIVHKGSALTHAHEISLIGCGIYSFILWELLKNPCVKSIYSGLAKARNFYRKDIESYFNIEEYKRLFKENFRYIPEENISSSDYVVDTLEAAIWCLLNTESYEECVLKAVNLGNDTDTVAAVAGGLAGALYGYQSIPKKWIRKLQKTTMIEQMCVEFYEVNVLQAKRKLFESIAARQIILKSNIKEDVINTIMRKIGPHSSTEKIEFNPFILEEEYFDEIDVIIILLLLTNSKVKEETISFVFNLSKEEIYRRLKKYYDSEIANALNLDDKIYSFVAINNEKEFFMRILQEFFPDLREIRKESLAERSLWLSLSLHSYEKINKLGLFRYSFYKLLLISEKDFKKVYNVDKQTIDDIKKAIDDIFYLD